MKEETKRNEGHWLIEKVLSLRILSLRCVSTKVVPMALAQWVRAPDQCMVVVSSLVANSVQV